MTLLTDLITTAGPPSAGFGALAGVVVHVRRRRTVAEWKRRARTRRPEPASNVQVLTTHQELTEALERAAAFETRTAELVNSRLARYDLLRAGPPNAPSEGPKPSASPPDRPDASAA
jgi:hypothetical protein